MRGWHIAYIASTTKEKKQHRKIFTQIFIMLVCRFQPLKLLLKKVARKPLKQKSPVLQHNKKVKHIREVSEQTLHGLP